MVISFPIRNPAHSTDDKCTDKDGVRYIVEIQMHYQASLSERMVYYSAAA
ncbi:MAG: Rpn family recombination-promoting nuclease/putative transposase [Bacteroidales bacterium]|jgi:hypothetical protein|nr:Rpn family recombination-promoting nuclease/putative transposase [Bacteroidales bacterium]